MSFIIDGHNLIPKIPGLSLRDLDDEPKLVNYVQEYCRLKRTSAELFFDGGLPGTTAPKGGGWVHIHLIRKGTTADDAIIDFLGQKGKSAKNFTVVSSDHHVQTQAHALGAIVMTSEQFAQDLVNSLSRSEKTASNSEKPLSSQEVEDWMNFFKTKGKPQN